jgi:hypothetical protein
MSFGTTKPTNPANNQSTSSGGSSESSSSWSDPSSVWGPQAQALQGLYGQGADLMNNFGQYEQQAQGIFDTALGGYNQMMNPGINPQLQAYSGEVQRNLERNLLPSIQGNAAGFGQMGGSRHGVAQGLALGDSNQQITNMASNLYNQDQNRTMQAMAMAPGLANFGGQIPWYAMNQYAGLLGDPTVLSGASGSSSSGSSWNESQSTGTGGGGGGGFNVGSGPFAPQP